MTTDTASTAPSPDPAALARRRADLRNYILVTGAYWAFMLTDGALRMLVLLHFHTLGFSPIQLAYLFLLYEFMGIVIEKMGSRKGQMTKMVNHGSGLAIHGTSAFVVEDSTVRAASSPTLTGSSVVLSVEAAGQTGRGSQFDDRITEIAVLGLYDHIELWERERHAADRASGDEAYLDEED